jgi:hypothetical protein
LGIWIRNQLKIPDALNPALYDAALSRISGPSEAEILDICKSKSGIVHSVCTSAASVSEVSMLPDLLLDLPR